MHNPFAQPHTPGQWLLGSVCWTPSCVGGWWLFNYYLPAHWQTLDNLTPLAYCASSGLAAGLLWLLTIKRATQVLEVSQAHFSALSTAANVGLVLWIFTLKMLMLSGISLAALYICGLLCFALLDWSVQF
jgi:hypothetical protein